MTGKRTRRLAVLAPIAVLINTPTAAACSSSSSSFPSSAAAASGGSSASSASGSAKHYTIAYVPGATGVAFTTCCCRA